jgi:minor extracellular serine protease Vpr
VITVAAHNTQVTAPNGNVFPGAIASFSSRGPTMDGLVKPDVSAPGVQILSSVSSFTTENYTKDMSVEFYGKTYDFSRFSGTSMSGPAVAGLAALLIEANPFLSPAQVKEILRKTARKDIRTGDLPEGSDNTWGTGKVDAYAAIKLALETEGEMKPDEIVLKKGVIYPNPSSGKIFYHSPLGVEENKVAVFDMNGKPVLESTIGTVSPLDLSYLRAGMYVVRIMEEKPEFHKVILFHY